MECSERETRSLPPLPSTSARSWGRRDISQAAGTDATPNDWEWEGGGESTEIPGQRDGQHPWRELLCWLGWKELQMAGQKTWLSVVARPLVSYTTLGKSFPLS